LADVPPPASQLVVQVVLADGRNAPGARAYVLDNAGGGAGFAIVLDTPTDVPLATYTVRAFAPWHSPVPHVDGNVLVNAPGVKVHRVTLAPMRYHLHVDADRNGAVDPVHADFSTWTWGAAGRGAVVLCNNDDDDRDGEGGHGTADNADAVINHNNDPLEMAPIEVCRVGAVDPPATWSCRLTILGGLHTKVNAFIGAAIGTAAVIGPAAGASHTLAALTFDRRALSMEALSYALNPDPAAGFDGTLDLEMTVTARDMDAALTASNGGALSYAERARFRVAPWIMPHHLDPLVRAYVADLGAQNVDLRDAIVDLLGATPVTAVPDAWHNGDRWLQDCMEIGYSNLPGRGMTAVLRAPRDGDLSTYPPRLLGEDFGYVSVPAVPVPDDATTYDSFGNLEVTPPVPGAGYPLGRIYYCNGTVTDVFNPEVRRFLEAQIVQQPFQVDATWLLVGHVDEMLTFIPANDRKGFRLVMASPAVAYGILDAVARPAEVRMLINRRLKNKRWNVRDGAWDQPFYEAELTVEEFLAQGLRQREIADLGAAGLARADGLFSYNVRCQGHLDRARDRFMEELGLDAADIIDVPVLFMPSKYRAGAEAGPAIPLTGDMVNLLINGNRCLAPSPFGPDIDARRPVGEADLFAADLYTKFRTVGVTASFVTVWEGYHLKHGEVHCGSNAHRRPAAWPRWWEYEHDG
jgi:protein-arginine deiminase